MIPAVKALARRRAIADTLRRSASWSTIMIAPIGGTKIPNRFSQSTKCNHTPVNATAAPRMPRITATGRIVVLVIPDQPSAPLYRQWVPTLPRFANTKNTAMTVGIALWPVSKPRNPPPLVAGLLDPPTSTTSPLSRRAAQSLSVGRGIALVMNSHAIDDVSTTWADFTAWVFVLAAIHVILTGVAKALSECPGPTLKFLGKTLESTSLIVNGLAGLYFFREWVEQYGEGGTYFLKVRLPIPPIGSIALSVTLVYAVWNAFRKPGGPDGETATGESAVNRPSDEVAALCTWINVTSRPRSEPVVEEARHRRPLPTGVSGPQLNGSPSNHSSFRQQVEAPVRQRPRGGST